MSWLVIETTDRAGGVGWGSTLEAMAFETWDEGSRHGEVLWPSIRRLAGDRLKGIEGVIAGVGPGRLTGVRVGLTVAKVICMTHGVPLVLVDRFEQIATEATQATMLVAMVPLMGRRVAAQGFAWQDGWGKAGVPKFCLDESLDMLRSLEVGHEPIVAGIGLESLAEALHEIWPGCVLQPSAHMAGNVRWMAEVGLAKVARGESTPLDEVRPIYYT